MKSTPEKELSFEDALEKLETLVTRMESGEVPLEEMIAKFEEGNRLLAACARRLHAAEQRIELLKKDRTGISFENLDPDET